MPDWPAIFSDMRNAGLDLPAHCDRTPLGGSGFSTTWRLRSGAGNWFLKTGPAESFDMFDAEGDGLRELQNANAARVPQVYGSGATESGSYLLLEWLELDRRSRQTDEQLGEQLAAQHRCTNDRFGWRRDNTIGATPQINTLTATWVDFYREHRLGFQLQLAKRNGYAGEIAVEGARLQDSLGKFFDDYVPQPSLLHGDLWAGNYAVVDGVPVIFDPAVYYGDRETDIAMTRLLGGFGNSFYDAYTGSWPLQPGHESRLGLYQLYHVLNHLNLFGTGYLGRALELLRSLNRALQAGGASADSSTR
jgi:fructosamine-3-kinase